MPATWFLRGPHLPNGIPGAIAGGLWDFYTCMFMLIAFKVAFRKHWGVCQSALHKWGREGESCAEVEVQFYFRAG